MPAKKLNFESASKFCRMQKYSVPFYENRLTFAFYRSRMHIDSIAIEQKGRNNHGSKII